MLIALVSFICQLLLLRIILEFGSDFSEYTLPWDQLYTFTFKLTNLQHCDLPPLTIDVFLILPRLELTARSSIIPGQDERPTSILGRARSTARKCSSFGANQSPSSAGSYTF